MMPLDDALETAALGDANRIHIIAGSKQRCAEHLTGFHFFGEIAKLRDALDRHATELFDVSEQRFGDAMFLLLAKPELDRVVPVALLGFALEHTIGAG